MPLTKQANPMEAVTNPIRNRVTNKTFLNMWRPLCHVTEAYFRHVTKAFSLQESGTLENRHSWCNFDLPLFIAV